MYLPTTIPDSLVQGDVGVWTPADHQRGISKLIMHLGILYHLEKRIVLVPLPETMLDESKVS